MQQWWQLPILAVLLTQAKATGSQKVTGNLIGELMSQVLIEHLDCHTVLVTTTSDSPYLDNTMKNVHGGVIMAGEIIDQKDWLQKLWWTSKTCKVVILHLNDQHNKTESALRLLEQVELQKHPDTRVVVLGTRRDVKAVLLHHSFRNTVHALYLAVHSNAFISIHTRPRLMSRLKYQVPEASVTQGVWVYRRCLYCNKGKSGVQYINTWKPTVPTFNKNQGVISLFHGENQLYNFEGHQLKWIAALYFPYIDFIRDSDDFLTTVTPKDCLDYRLIVIFAKKLNFTYTIYQEPYNSWGEDKDGVFSGLSGYLQREEMDLCTIAAPTSLRLKVAYFLRSYPTDPMTIVSLKPQPLPKQLAFIRPFNGI